MKKLLYLIIIIKLILDKLYIKKILIIVIFI